MLTRDFNHNIPTIHMYLCKELKDLKNIDEILWGIEEEGIPCKVLKNEESLISEKLSYIASQLSRLSVGIGIDKTGKVTLTLNKLKENEPLFVAHIDDSPNNLRNLGSNAGRLVKGIPFK